MAYKNLIIWTPSWHPRLNGYLVNGATTVPSNIHMSPTLHSTVAAADAETFGVSHSLSTRIQTNPDVEPSVYDVKISRWVLDTDTTPLCRIYGNLRTACGAGSAGSYLAVFADYHITPADVRHHGLAFLDDLALTTDLSGNFQTYAVKGMHIILHFPGSASAFSIAVPDDDSIDLMDLDLEPVDLRRNN